MKQLSWKLMVVATICSVIGALGSQTSFAAQKKSARYVGESVNVSASAPASRSSGINRISLGMTTIPMFPGGGSILSGSSPGLSALLDLNDGNSIQAIFSIGYPLTGFNVSVGGIFRHDIKTSGDSGFHVGGGLGVGVGAATVVAGFGGGGYNFGLIGAGVGGFHVAVPGTSGNLVAHFDASLGVGFTAGTSTAFYTSLGALSSALGLSLHYAL